MICCFTWWLCCYICKGLAYHILYFKERKLFYWFCSCLPVLTQATLSICLWYIARQQSWFLFVGGESPLCLLEFKHFKRCFKKPISISMFFPITSENSRCAYITKYIKTSSEHLKQIYNCHTFWVLVRKGTLTLHIIYLPNSLISYFHKE